MFFLEPCPRIITGNRREEKGKEEKDKGNGKK